MRNILAVLILSLTSVLASASERILVQGAMDMEVNHLIKVLENAKEERSGAWTFWVGNMGKKEVIVSRTEVGLTNAGAATAIAIEKYKPTVIINQGTSGGHDPKLHTGDIVLAQSTVNMGAVRTERKEYGVAENPRDGIFFDVVQRLRDKENKPENHKEFHSDKKLLEIAKKTEYKNGKLSLGVVGSADQWNRELERIKYLNEKFNSSTEEMETVAVAQVAQAYNIPFIGIRILSNTEIHNEDFNPKTALWCQEYTVDFIKNLK